MRWGTTSSSRSPSPSPNLRNRPRGGEWGETSMQKPGSANLESQQPEPAPAGQSDTPASRRDFLRNALGAASAIVLAQLIPSPAEAQIPAGAPFANPAGVATKKRKLPARLELHNEIPPSRPKD